MSLIADASKEKLRYIYLYKKSTMYPSIPITNELISNSVVLSKHNIKGDVHIL